MFYNIFRYIYLLYVDFNFNFVLVMLSTLVIFYLLSEPNVTCVSADGCRGGVVPAAPSWPGRS